MTSADQWFTFANGVAVPVSAVPELSPEQLAESVVESVEDGARLAAWFGEPDPAGGVRLWAVIADDAGATVRAASARLPEGAPVVSITPDCPQAHLFEREVFEQFGIRPEGHPWLKPVRVEPGTRIAGERAAAGGCADFFAVDGEDVHEVAVGPVHAGIIEPGHFRFQCAGEEVLHLEIALGYQHRGVERALIGGPDKRSVHYAETLAGDTSLGHGIAFAENVEALGATVAPARGCALRAVGLELERLANHCGDLGALAGDVGFLPTQAYCGRIRGDFLNMTAMLCGNRFGRGLVRPGGVSHDADQARITFLLEALESAWRDARSAIELLWQSASVMARFEGAGAVDVWAARDLGLVGPAARACGLSRDARQDHPSGIFRFSQIPVATMDSGDVLGRAWVRWMEMQHSVAFIREQCAHLPPGEVGGEVRPARGAHVAVALVEGWRGEICHVAITGDDGKFRRYKVVDPSFRNWTGLAMALRGQPISDFPLCNKSFNLSYCGHDL